MSDRPNILHLPTPLGWHVHPFQLLTCYSLLVYVHLHQLLDYSYHCLHCHHRQSAWSELVHPLMPEKDKNSWINKSNQCIIHKIMLGLIGIIVSCSSFILKCFCIWMFWRCLMKWNDYKDPNFLMDFLPNVSQWKFLDVTSWKFFWVQFQTFYWLLQMSMKFLYKNAEIC